MRAMVFDGQEPRLALRDIPRPSPKGNQVLLRVEACGVCRTDLHVVDGDLHEPRLPLIPGHEIVGRIEALGEAIEGLKVGQRVGVPWLGHTCGACDYCGSGRENLCDAPDFTGYTIDGGYAEYCVADAHFVFALPEDRDPVALAPLLCAGLIGYRSFKLAGDCRTLGIYGFGAAAHICARLPAIRAARFLPSRAKETSPPSGSPTASAQYGRADRANLHPDPLMPRSFSHRSALSCRWP